MTFLTLSTLPTGEVGVLYNEKILTSGGTGAVTFALGSGSALPPGLGLNSSTGEITGTGTVAGSFTFTLTATDSVGAATSRNYTLPLNPPLQITAPAALPGSTQGIAYSQTFLTGGGVGTVTFGLGAGSALPTGLTLASTGVLSGTPTQSGAFSFTITATDSLGGTAARPYNLQLAPPVVIVSPTSLPGVEESVAYSQTISASGGTGALSFGPATGSTLPPGLTLNSATGVLSGKVTASGTFTFEVSATDTVGATGSKSYTLIVTPGPRITAPDSLPGDTVGVPYSQTISASGGTGVLTFSLGAGDSLPPGLSLDSSTGLLAGTPTTVGSFPFTVLVTDIVGGSGARSYTFNVVPRVTFLGSSTLPTSEIGLAYNQTLPTNGGTGTLTFGVSAGTVPTGLALSSSGVLSGTPVVIGTFTFTVVATDSVGAGTVQDFTIEVVPALQFTGSASLPPGTQGAAYSHTIGVSGGAGVLTFGLARGGSLPTGLSLDSATGVLSGTPTQSGAFSFTLTVTDSLGGAAARPSTLQIAPPLVIIDPPSLPTKEEGAVYNEVLTVAGGSGGVTFEVTDGTSLPPGLTLGASTGVIGGMPTTAGTYTFTVLATDSAGATATRSYTVKIDPGPKITGPVSLPDTTLGLPYNQTITASGGTGELTFGLLSGSTPSGLQIDVTTGQLFGTITAPGVFNFTVVVSDIRGGSGSRTYSLTVNPVPQLTDAHSLPPDAVGVPYSHPLTTTGGTAPLTFALAAGSTLPLGLSLDTATGVLSGIPTTVGSFSFTITLTDALGVSASRDYTLAINPAPQITGPANLPAGTQGTAYSQTISVSGGTGTVTFALAAGSGLPGGLSLNSATGVIAGTPTQVGSFSVTVTVTDSLGGSDSINYLLAINPAIVPPPPPPSDSPAGIVSFDPNSATWYVRLSATPGAPDGGQFAYGAPNWIPVLGDWNGDGVVTIGLFDPTTATWYLRNENSAGAPDAGQFQYGAPGWIPVVGDWTGTGRSAIGVVDPVTGTWYLRGDASPGLADVGQFPYGAPGWVPVTGDWNGDGKTDIGVFAPDGSWYLRNSASTGAPDIGPFLFGAGNWQPVSGDWDGDGTDGIGVIDLSGGWYLRSSASGGLPDAGVFSYGAGGWVGLGGVVSGVSQATAARAFSDDLLQAALLGLLEEEKSPLDEAFGLLR